MKKGKVDKEVEEKKITGYRVQLGDSERLPPVSPTFGKFPYIFWAEWDKDCVNNYGGTRWMKAWQDHIVAMQTKKEDALWNLDLELKNRIDAFEATANEVQEEDARVENDKSEVVKTLGGKEYKGD